MDVPGALDPDVRAWIEASTGCTVRSSQRLLGGMSSDVRAVWVDETPDAVVVRHITDRAWLRREPGLIVREAAALELLAPGPVVAPRLLASDAVRGLLLMTHVPGELRVRAPTLTASVDALAAIVAAVSATPLPDPSPLPAWRSWVADDVPTPDWGDRGLWRRAIAAHAAGGPPAAEAPVLLHRDLHPLNVLWGPTGPAVVDWVNASIGNPHAELAHLAWNMAVLTSPEVAASLLRRCTDGRGIDPWWVLDCALDKLPDPPGTAGWHAVGATQIDAALVCRVTEHLVREALEQLDAGARVGTD